MSSFLLFLLIFLLWSIGLYFQLNALHKQVGLATAASYLLRCAFHRYQFDGNDENNRNRLFLGIFLMMKAGKLLLLSLLIRVVIFAQRAEAILLILILLIIGIALYYLSFRKNGIHSGYRSVYTLSEGFGVYELVLSPSGICGEWIGATLAELDLRKKELLVLSIVRSGNVMVFPKGPEVLFADDQLLVFGKSATLPAPTLQDEMKF